jgi:aarF domain-containing kinase
MPIKESMLFLHLTGFVGRISPKTWATMEVFLGLLASIATEEYESMASALIEMGATNKDIDSRAFARDLEKIFSSIKARTVCVCS